MEQSHSGSGDNIGNNKIERQIIQGDGSVYIENQAEFKYNVLQVNSFIQCCIIKILYH